MGLCIRCTVLCIRASALQNKRIRIRRIDLFTTRHKVVHNGGSLNFKGLLFDKKTNYLAKSYLQSVLYHTTKIQYIWIVYSNSGYIRHYGPDSLLL